MANNSQAMINEMMLRSISSFARIAIINNASPILPEDFLARQQSITADLDHIRTEDLMLMAAGQITSKVILNYLNEDA